MQPGNGDEIQVIRDELESLRAEVRATRSGRGHRWWRGARRPRLTRTLSRVGLVALMLAMPVMVSAGHQFTDVPTSHSFHTVISRIYGARLTTGCSTSRFCPSANVTRGQMAAFLARGLGRGSGSWGATGFEDGWAIFDGGALDGIDLAHGGTSGGTGHVFVTASTTAYTSEPGVCPCELAVRLINADTGEESPAMFDVIGSEPAPEDSDAIAWFETATSVSYLFSVPSGATHTYVLAASMRTTLPPSEAFDAGVEWTLTGAYLPFGATGGNPSLTSTQGTKSPRAD